MEILFTASLWEWPGQSAWYFVSLPKEYYADIKRMNSSIPKRGFGSVRVEARIGSITWKTSIFPDTKTKAFLLPIKKGVRKAENLTAGSVAEIKIRLIDF
jgi:Domain of unknown function (DUF1905)